MRVRILSRSIVLGGLAWTASTLCAQTIDPALNTSSRLVHRFDFDERSQGNLEDLPKFWVPLRPPDFPYFADGHFDETVGHDAPPSFHLGSEGGNVAYQYRGPEARVRVNTDYHIIGYLKPDRLVHARGCVSAHYLDESGQSLLGTLVRTPFFGDKDVATNWIRFDLELTKAPKEADSITLTAWVLQETTWRSETRPSHAISLTDVHAGMWVDDVAIYALPHVAMTTTSTGDVLPANGPQNLLVTLADNRTTAVVGNLTIQDAGGTVVDRRVIPVTRGAMTGPFAYPLGALPPGLYRARLDVEENGVQIVSRTLTFAKLAERYHDRKIPCRSFGVVLDAANRTVSDTELSLLEQLGAGSVKIPIWTGLVEAQRSEATSRDRSRLIQALAKRGFAMFGVFFGPPDEVIHSGAGYVRPLLDLLADDPKGWRDAFSAEVAPFAGVFRTWQVGPDRAPTIGSTEEMSKALGQVRKELRPFISVPKLAIPVNPATFAVERTLPVDEVTATLESDTQVEQIGAQIARLRSLGYKRVSAYLAPLAGDAFVRLPRLADWAQRIITARHLGAETVYVPQPWQVDLDTRKQTVVPRESFLIMHTIADLLGDARPGPSLLVAKHVKCLAFHDGNESVVAMWDTDAPPEGNTYAIQLGKADEQIDVWGRRSPLPRDQRGRQVVRLTDSPVFIPGVERWLIEFRAAVQIAPRELRFGAQVERHTIDIQYRGDETVLGEIHLLPPVDWEVTPRTITFAVSPRRTESFPIRVQFPHTEPAGEKAIVARIQLSGSDYEMDVPLRLALESSDLDVWALTYRDGNDLVVRHVIKNLSKDILSFRASASILGRERQHRPVPNIRPGELQAVEYRFRNAAELSGKSVYLMIREVNDGPRSHSLEKLIP